jgi:hypothetical protein
MSSDGYNKPILNLVTGWCSWEEKIRNQECMQELKAQ